jgi:hypothetical protein
MVGGGCLHVLLRTVAFTWWGSAGRAQDVCFIRWYGLDMDMKNELEYNRLYLIEWVNLHPT